SRDWSSDVCSSDLRIVEAAVESMSGTAEKSTTYAFGDSPMLSSAAPTLAAAPKKNAPVILYTSTSGSVATWVSYGVRSAVTAESGTSSSITGNRRSTVTA